MRIGFIGTALMLAICSCPGQRTTLQFPNPPQQGRSWRADAAIPTNILSAVETLFEQGFPDPRGCEYREIEVQTSAVWGGQNIQVNTRGWLLPNEATGTNRFAICWNGLIYPVTNVGEPADLRASLTNAGFVMDRRFVRGIGETHTVTYSDTLSTRVLLLLRCGETEAALKSWSPNSQLGSRAPFPQRNAMGEARLANHDPYLEFASDWAWALFDRTISAHMRGDEALALATARKLAEVQPRIEAECARRGFSRGQSSASPRQAKEKPYLDFLEQLPQLLADLERRASEPAHVSVIESGLDKLTEQSKRIAALIRDLDLVQARQRSQPGGVNLAEDPIVSALIQEGDAAVEPLLECLENDTRLTRSVGFGRDFFRNRTVLPVKSAASVAIQSILQASFRGGAPEMRAYWDKYKGMNLDERCYAILKDDSAAARWLEVATRITQPENESRFPGGFSMTQPAPTNTPVRLRGETLRTKFNPTVSELMARRALEVREEDLNSYDLAGACRMGLHLAAWDAQAAGPVARTLVKRCCTTMKYSSQQLGSQVAKLTMVRVNAGDERPFDDYAEWLKTTTPEQLDHSVLEWLEPLMKFPDDAVLRSAAESLFSGTNSTWTVFPWKGVGPNDPIASGLVNVPAFRRLLARKLDNTAICGSIEYRAPANVRFQITNYLSGGREVAFPEGRHPENGTKAELRWCDWIAWSLSNSKQIPFFNPFEPIEERDEAIANARQLLE